MQRQQLEHILRAAAGITGADRFVIVGSQSILGQFPNAPHELLRSVEADLYSLRNPQDSNLIDGSIGEGSPFHQTFGYHAHGVDEKTAVLPKGWKDRLIEIRTPSTGSAIGLCLEVHDLAVSKLVAGRDNDIRFVAGLLRHHLAQRDVIRQRLLEIQLDDRLREACDARLDKAVGG
jgi:hypothetical protein